MSNGISNFHKETLPNGLRWAALPMPGVDTAAVVIGAKVGAAHEELEVNYGVAHFLEHLFFKGGKRYPKPKEVALAIDRVGGVSNAFTSYLNTHYWVAVPAQHLSVAFDVLEDMMCNATIPAEELERERKVILEEINRYEDDPESVVWYALQESLFGDQPLGGTIIGTRDSIRAMNREGVLSFREKNYHPRNLAIAVAGNVSPEAVAKEVERWFGGWKREDAAEAQPSIDPLQTGETIKAISRSDLAQAHLMVGISVPVGIKDPRAWPLEIAAFALGGSLSSRFFHLIREERGLAYRVSTSFDAYLHVGAFSTYVGTSPENIGEVLSILQNEHASLAEKGISEEEFLTAREALAGRYALRSETTHASANHLAFATLYDLAEQTPHQARERILSVTYSEVQEALKKVEGRSLHLALVSPLSEPQAREIASTTMHG
ncbi:insulinase family protein [Candidatus Parcubacteria bacterium]|nr:MAG: insulinase family protein [Candidatus Parcubacteria bacterium]